MPLENPEGYGEQSSLYHFYSFVPTNSGEYPKTQIAYLRSCGDPRDLRLNVFFVLFTQFRRCHDLQ